MNTLEASSHHFTVHRRPQTGRGGAGIISIGICIHSTHRLLSHLQPSP